ncbi:MAG: leucyl aminopeptidase [Candidatus Magasanikbacteria bacterium]
MINYKFTDEDSAFDCLIIPMFEGVKFEKTIQELDEVNDGLFSEIEKLKDFEAKSKQQTLFYTGEKSVPRVLLLGLGKEKELTVRAYKQMIGGAVITLQGKKMQVLGFLIPEELIKEFSAKKLGKETMIAIETANYAFDEHKKKDDQVKPLKEVWFSGLEDKKMKDQFEKGIEEGQKIGECVNMTRQLGNTPPTVMTPAFLAKEAEKLAKDFFSIKTTVLSLAEIKKKKMGCLLGVARGSREEPKFIIVEYTGDKAKDRPIVLVGKGITFDSGGLSIKPGNFMTDMKFDMLGAATVLGSLRAVAALGLKKHLIGLIPTCENMPGGDAYRPDDILTAMNGKTVLVENTDAEGRLILADALSYASTLKPKHVINFATLTGACMVALGNERSGLFSKDKEIVEKLKKSSEEVGEQVWHLPMGEEYTEAMKCEIADVKNLGGVGGDRYAGASTAAAFLEYFTDYPFAHIDLSCSYYGGKGKSFIRSGANGFGVQTMVEYLT